MHIPTRAAGGLAVLLFLLAPHKGLTEGAAPAAIPPADAARVFAEARTICERDHGQLWNHSLCGPIMLVQPMNRAIATNRADLRQVLTANGPIFTGVLPASENIANTATPWSGVYWTQIIWPLPQDDAARHVLIAHELFHRIQPDLDTPRLKGGDNDHLDTLEGRYLLQLEWRALTKALETSKPDARRRAVEDALAFRAERYRLFAAAADEERALELNEGLAEYTGVRRGLADPTAQTAYAVHDLADHVGDATFVRSFAYATGPAYGLLLDRYAPGWRRRLKRGPRLDALLRAALPRISERSTLEARAAAYGGPALRTAEVERDRKRQTLLTTLRARFVSGPVVHIPTPHMNYEFNPTALQPLDNLGTVYPHMRLTADFGVLEADNGALLSKDFSSVTVSAAGADIKALKGDGWRLILKPGWTVGPGARAGDWVVSAQDRP